MPSLVDHCRVLDPDNIYGAVLNHPQLVQIGGGTGHCKSLMMANIGIIAAAMGRQVRWLMGEMQAQEVWLRLWGIFRGIAPAALQPSDVSDETVMSNIAVLDLPRTLSELLWAIREAVRTAPADSAILLDNADGLPIPREIADALTAELADAAARQGLTIVLTSQVTRGAQPGEIVQGHELAFSNAKTHAAGSVLTLGPRVLHEIMTVCITKDRSGVFGGRSVRRLYLDPSLRMLPEPTTGMIAGTDVIPPRQETPDPCVHVNDLPGDFTDEDANLFTDDAVDEEPLGERFRPYHGTKGHIPIGRKICQSAAFREADLEVLGFLLILYEHAAFMPDKKRAPATHIPVQLRRGEFVTSERILAHELDLTPKKVRGLLNTLERDGLIRRELIMADGSRQKTGKGAGADAGPAAVGSVVVLCDYAASEIRAANTDAGSNARKG